MRHLRYAIGGFKDIHDSSFVACIVGSWGTVHSKLGDRKAILQMSSELASQAMSQ